MDELSTKCRIDQVRISIMCYAITCQIARLALVQIGLASGKAHELCTLWIAERGLLWRFFRDQREQKGEAG